MPQRSRVVSPSLPQVFPIPLHLNRMSLKIPKGVVKIRKSKNKRQHIPPKEKVQKDKQRSIKHTHRTKARVKADCYEITEYIYTFI